MPRRPKTLTLTLKPTLNVTLLQSIATTTLNPNPNPKT